MRFLSENKYVTSPQTNVATCLVTVCFCEQEVEGDSIFFWLSLEIPRWLEPDNFISTSFPSLISVVYQGSIQLGNQIAKEKSYYLK